MGLFSRDEPVDEPDLKRIDRDRAWNGAAKPDIANITSGSAAIRARLWSRWRRGNLARTAMDLQFR